MYATFSVPWVSYISMISIVENYYTSCRSMVHHGDDDENVIIMMITWQHSMIVMLDECINHGMNDVKV